MLLHFEIQQKVLSKSSPQLYMVQNDAPLATHTPTQDSAELPHTAVFPLGPSWHRRQLLSSLGGIPEAAICAPDAPTQQDEGAGGAMLTTS